MNKVISIFIISVFIITGLALFSQNQTSNPTSTNQSLKSETGKFSNTITPIVGWKYFPFGLTYEQVKTSMSNNYPLIQLRREDFPDLPDTVNYLYLETYEDIYYKKIEFQFSPQDQHYLTRIQVNPRYFSYLTLYNNFYQKYGPPQKVNVNQITWLYEQNQLTLNRENVITYFRDGILTNVTIPPNINAPFDRPRIVQENNIKQVLESF